MSLKKIENAKVEIKINHDSRSESLSLSIIVNDIYQHTFPFDSRESKLLQEMESSVILNKMNGGTFIFTEDGILVDYRTSDYKGFMHSEDAIKKLSEKIGLNVAEPSRKSARDLFSQFREEKGIFLGGLSDPFYLDIASLGEGGSFKNRIVYKWNPFQKDILTTIEVERLICLNGMVGVSPLTTRKVPVINDWERHLEIVSLQIQPSINNLLQDRFIKMADTNSSVSNILEGRKLLLDRREYKAAENCHILTNLLDLTDVESRLGGVYQKEVFTKGKGATAKSDLTQFDLFNVLTEACSHTSGTSESTLKIQKFLNNITFDYSKNEISGNAKISDESDPSRVFFGKRKGE